jgi:hypothetical protein
VSPSRSAQRRDGTRRGHRSGDFLAQLLGGEFLARYTAWLASPIRPVDPPAFPTDIDSSEERTTR